MTFKPSEEIVLNETLDPNNLIPFLENLYLQENSSFRLVFNAKMLPTVQRAFDSIIFRHGLTTSSFDFFPIHQEFKKIENY